MGGAGGIILGELIEDLENRLDNYLGSLNEIRMGSRADAEEKPIELILYEQINEMHIPLLDGGIQDQPHIWILQYATVNNRQAMWKRIIDNATKRQGPT